MAFLADRLATGNIEDKAFVHPFLSEQVEENNQIVRDIAQRYGAVLVETSSLANQRELFVDDCHVRAAGHFLRAKMIADAILNLQMTDNKS